MASRFTVLAVCMGLLVIIAMEIGADYEAKAPNGSKKPHPTTSQENPLGWPVRIARADSGNVYVSDHSKRQILEYKKKDFATFRAIPVAGKPLGVAVVGGSLVVGNASSRRVEVYSTSGTLKYILGGADSEVIRPNDIAVDGDLIFVVDSSANVVKIFDTSEDPAGTLVGTIPPDGPNPNILLAPTCVAVDPARKEVLVSSYGAARSFSLDHAAIQIFNYQGELLDTIEGKPQSDGQEGGMGMGMGWGWPKAQFTRPQGLAVDGKGHIFLVDCLLGRVLVLNRSDGKQVAALGTYGTEGGQLFLPMDLVIVPGKGDVYVTNSRLRRIEVFEKGAVLR